MQITIRFRPPEITFAFNYGQKILIFSPPNVYLNLAFEVSATVNFAMVLTSKGIREAVEQRKPEKALKSIAIRDEIDGVDTPIVTFSIEVTAGVSVSGKKIPVQLIRFCAKLSLTQYLLLYPLPSGNC